MADAELFKVEAGFTVHDGKAEAAEAIRARMIQHAAVPGGLSFELQFDDDHRQLRLKAGAVEEEQIRQLLLRIGPDLEQLESHAKVSAVQCKGPFSAALRKALSPFNAGFA